MLPAWSWEHPRHCPHSQSTLDSLNMTLKWLGDSFGVANKLWSTRQYERVQVYRVASLTADQAPILMAETPSGIVCQCELEVSIKYQPPARHVLQDAH